ncbi:MAG: hypothetical protein QOJ60_1919 [Actinomycetota bacterium]|jgi:uncharacterized protein YndB with AHSA1/START domain|nr:hypothetical protein [Actinomycetota bacterium]
MTSNAPTDSHIVGSLRSADGAGIVRLEARLDTHVADLWSVLADPDCLNRWLGEVEGDLSPPWTTSPPMGRETRSSSRISSPTSRGMNAATHVHVGRSSSPHARTRQQDSTERKTDDPSCNAGSA